MCSGGSPGPWINNQATQAALFKHRMEVSISNASSDSGDVIIAGYILLKDPTITHRIHYISSIRQDLPNLPFFDLGIHRRSPHGSEVSHLVVRCGEKVADQLSTNLSSYLNGTHSTSMYISRVHVMNTPPDEVNSLFDIHAKLSVHILSTCFVDYSTLPYCVLYIYISLRASYRYYVTPRCDVRELTTRLVLKRSAFLDSAHNFYFSLFLPQQHSCRSTSIVRVKRRRAIK